jgi:hypothetical protein
MCGAALSAVVYIAAGSPILLIFPGFVLVGMAEPCVLSWPWHHLSCELSWVLAIAAIGGYTKIHPISESISSVQEPSAAVLLSLRLLLFRVLFGFGKLKFSGSTMKDIMYIRPFCTMVPILTFIGMRMYRELPRVLFIVSYGMFFLIEIVLPWFFFFPNPYRAVAAVSAVQLMLGIQLTGSFGTFNVLTSALCVPLLSSIPSASSTTAATMGDTVTTVVLAVHSLSGLCLLLFNSWVTGSWFLWPAFVRGLPRVCRWFEALSTWYACNSYGVFPPGILSPLRVMPVFEISHDGKSWTALRYRFQPTLAKDKAAFYPVIHPILEFCLYYSGLGPL